MTNGKIAFLTASEGVERVELTDPWQAVTDAGYEPVLLSPDGGQVALFDHLDKASTQSADGKVADANIDDYVALVLPGGVANPDALRQDEDAVGFVRQFVTSGKPVAAICHAPWVLIEADVVSGRQVTSWPSLQSDISNAGGDWVDQSVVIDGNLITSRKPDDLPDFDKELLRAIESHTLA